MTLASTSFCSQENISGWFCKNVDSSKVPKLAILVLPIYYEEQMSKKPDLSNYDLILSALASAQKH